MVEHPAVNRNVVGSSPTFGAIFINIGKRLCFAVNPPIKISSVDIFGIGPQRNRFYLIVNILTFNYLIN